MTPKPNADDYSIKAQAKTSIVIHCAGVFIVIKKNK